MHCHDSLGKVQELNWLLKHLSSFSHKGKKMHFHFYKRVKRQLEQNDTAERMMKYESDHSYCKTNVKKKNHCKQKAVTNQKHPSTSHYNKQSIN